MSEIAGSKSLIRIAAAGIVRAPRRIKLALLFNVMLIAGVGAASVLDTDRSGGAARVVALSLTMGGALLLSVASVLWTMSQRGAQCGFIEFKREAFKMRARKLDEVLIAFPVLAFVAGCMVAAGLSVFASVVTGPFARGALAGMGVWFFAWTTAMIAATTRFLYTHAREQAEAAERARGEATEAQLAALQAQMNPHFLFNTLNTVASLVRTDAAAAEATVENLAVVLRRTLDRSGRIFSTVDDEIDHLAAYISVAKQRFEDRLQVHWSVDPEARALLLPTMTLQPLVENALKHGIGARLEGGALHIGVHLENAPEGGDDAEERGASSGGRQLVVEVADDGPGFPRRHREGTGLSNLRTRLETLYGGEARLTIHREGPGSRVVVAVPEVHAAAEILGDAAGGASDDPVAVASEQR